MEFIRTGGGRGGRSLESCTVSLFLNLILNGAYGMSLKAGNSVSTMGFETVVNIYSIVYL